MTECGETEITSTEKRDYGQPGAEKIEKMAQIIPRRSDKYTRKRERQPSREAMEDTDAGKSGDLRREYGAAAHTFE